MAGRRIEVIRETGSYGENICRLRVALKEAEAVVIGAGSGLSTAAGYTYGGERFRQHFADFEAACGFHDMYSGGFYPYEKQEQFWAFMSRNVLVNRYLPIPNSTYSDLLELVQEKDYFVLTTNVDHCFQRAGFEKARLFYTQGDYGLFQCSLPCHKATYENEESIRRMVAEQRNMEIPSALLPHCPRCGRVMSMNLRGDDTFAEDEGWNAACDRYMAFIRAHERGRVLYWELGVGFNTPVFCSLRAA